jgi:hypothetical protein
MRVENVAVFHGMCDFLLREINWRVDNSDGEPG